MGSSSGDAEGRRADQPSVMIYTMGEVIGDGVIKLAFAAAVREAFPDAWIVWCAGKGSTVYAGPLKKAVVGLIDEVLMTGRMGARVSDHLFNPFGGRRFDLVIDTQGNVSRGLYARRAAKRFVSRVVWAKGFRSRKYEGEPPIGMLDRLTDLLEIAHGQRIPPRAVKLTDDRALAAARALLPDGAAYVGLAPGAGGQEKRWPLERYWALAELAAAAGHRPVFFFGPDERADLDLTRARAPDALYPEFDRTDDFADVKGPVLVIALAERLAAAVANDAGPGHMLAAGGAPLVSLQRTHWLATKFKPSAPTLSLLVAEDFGPGGMAAIPVGAAWKALQDLIAAEAT
ncbi:MAG TPA: glycosyltransferase family 9 protein [Caulobacteraceae bacterium]|nr:glycosyltransferase family 9 protein [Caulobacteraceae bacterium]